MEKSYEYNIIFPGDAPVNASRPIVAKYMSLSIEVNSFPRLLGSASSPQIVTKACLELMNILSGSYPDIRVTGMDSFGVQFVEDVSIAVSETINQYGKSGLLIDTNWLTWFSLYPQGVTFTIGLPFVSVLRGSSTQLKSLLDMTKAVVHGLADRLSGFELGNEPDQLEGYTGEQYTTDFLYYANLIRTEILLPSSITRPMFVFGTLAREYKDTFAVEDLVYAGANSSAATELISSFSNHKYPYNNCDFRNQYTVADLLDHQQAVYYGLYNPIKSMASVFESGWNGMALGEVNSICCGQSDVTNSFANAVWMVDYALYGAYNNITRMSIHFGDLINYAPWLPADATLDGQAIVHPTFYGMLLVSEALGSRGDSTVTLMDWNNRHIFYAIHSNGALRSIVIVNTDNHSSSSRSSRASITAHLHTTYSNFRVRAKLLSADYADSTTGFSYDGLTYSDITREFVDDKTQPQYVVTDAVGALDIEVGASQVMLLSFVDTVTNSEILARIQSSPALASSKPSQYAEVVPSDRPMSSDDTLSQINPALQEVKLSKQGQSADITESYRPREGVRTISSSEDSHNFSWSSIAFLLIFLVVIWQVWSTFRRSRGNRNKLH